jgi:regulator of protease activity HflC (stomatin/prohibitin superfamily)
LYSLQLTNIIESINKRMSSQKKGMRAIRKQIAAEQKEIAKMKAKVEKAEAKAKLKIERTAEKERIKADAKRVREEAKLGKGVLSTLSTGTVSGSETSNTGVQLVLDEPVNEIPGKAEDTPNVALVEEVANETSKMPEETSLLHGEQPRAAGNTPTLDYEEPQVERKLLVIPMEEK